MTAPQPSWRQLAAVPESHTKAAVLHALGIEPPPEGVSRYLDLGNGLKMEAGEAGLIVTDPQRGSRYEDPKTIAKQLYLSKGTPSGELTRAWLTARGLLP